VDELRRLVSQLLEQGATRVYLVDNSPLTFDTFSAWEPPERVVIIRTGRNLGYGAGHNLAIRDSVLRHRYHLVCNPDIDLGPDVLPRLHSALEERPDVGLCMPRIVGRDGALQYACKRAPSPIDYLARVVSPAGWGARRRFRFEMRDCSYDGEMEVECLSGCFMFFRSAVLSRLSGFDERFFLYFEDFDLARRARRLARNLYYPFSHVTHGYARAHAHSWRLTATFVRSAVRYFNKWGWWPNDRA